MEYWFRPKRFWNYFAFYVPTSWQGWILTLILLALFIGTFFYVDGFSHSGGDTLIAFAPWGILYLVIFDFLCFRFGEYPAWWRSKLKNQLPGSRAARN